MFYFTALFYELFALYQVKRDNF
uniref:Uncharacterized protein n=1 Tax=Anguilla anguilla TaxID=7936 RepID=A0A0E9SPY7_ANGAN